MHRKKAEILRNHKYKLHRELSVAKKQMGIHTDSQKENLRFREKSHPYQQAIEKRNQMEKEIEEQRALQAKRLLEIEQARIKRKSSHLLCTSKTKKGQPIMSDRIKHLLCKLK